MLLGGGGCLLRESHGTRPQNLLVEWVCPMSKQWHTVTAVLKSGHQCHPTSSGEGGQWSQHSSAADSLQDTRPVPHYHCRTRVQSQTTTAGHASSPTLPLKDTRPASGPTLTNRTLHLHSADVGNSAPLPDYTVTRPTVVVLIIFVRVSPKCYFSSTFYLQSFLSAGMEPSALVLRPLSGLLYQPWAMYDDDRAAISAAL
jgi:hypothetical protein